MGKPTSEQDGAFIFKSPVKQGDFVMDTAAAAPDELFTFTDPTEPPPPQYHETEPHIVEPYIEIADTKISTRGGNLASTALKNIMDTFNAASSKTGLDKKRPTLPEHRFNEQYGGAKASLPDIVADFMDAKAVGASLQDDDKFPDQDPRHKRDIEILNGSDIKRASGRPEELIAFEESQLKKWLVENYGADDEENAPDTTKRKVTYKDRAKLVKKVQDLEGDAKKIASGEMLPYGSIDSDEAPLSDEERDIADQDERKFEDR